MTTAIVPVSGPAPLKWGMDREQIDLLKRTIAKGTSDDEFALFATTAQRMGLDPFARQIHAVMRWDSDAQRNVMAIQVGIDGYRSVAHRTGEYDGQDAPMWCGPDGIWRDVWLGEGHPSAAKVLVYRKGISRPFTGIATFKSYAQRKRNGDLNSMWSRGDDFMLAKVSEALALRKGFPSELSGTLVPEELGNDAIDVTFTELPKEASKSVQVPEQPKAPAAIATAPAVTSTSTTAATTTEATIVTPPPVAEAAPPPAAAPKASGKPTLDADGFDALKTSLRAAKNDDDIKAVSARVVTFEMSKEWRDELSAIRAEQKIQIRDAAKAEREASGQLPLGGTP